MNSQTPFQAPPVPCPQGSYAEKGAVECTKCPAGKYCPSTSSPTETTCPAGSLVLSCLSVCFPVCVSLSVSLCVHPKSRSRQQGSSNYDRVFHWLTAGQASNGQNVCMNTVQVYILCQQVLVLCTEISAQCSISPLAIERLYIKHALNLLKYDLNHDA